MKQDVPENFHELVGRDAPELEEISEAARFPAENPNPVFRVAPDGRLLYANRASKGLLAHWGVVGGGCLPPQWRDRIAEVLAAGEARKWDVQVDNRVLQLHCVPIIAGSYVNVYAADVTERVDALEALRASEARYRTLFDSIDEGFCVIEVLFDENGKPVDYVFLEANPAFERQTGLVDAMGRRIREMVPLHEEHWFQIYGEIARTGKPARFENAAAQLGRYYDVYAFRIGDPSERKVAVLFSDVAPRKQAEAERDRLWHEVEARNRELEAQAAQIQALNAGLEQRVQERTAELEAVFASIPDCLYVGDASGILRANQASLEAFGCDSVEQLRELLPRLAEKMRSRYADTGELIPPADLGIARALRGEHAVLETLTRNPRTGEEQLHRVAAAPIRVDGQIIAAVAHATDITEQKRNELELAYQASLLANVTDAVVATDLEHCVTSWNRAAEEMFGWSEAEVLGRPIHDIVPTELVNTSLAEGYQRLAEEGRWRGEMIITRRDGGQVHVEATAVPVRDARGRVVGQVGVNRDITAQKQARAQIDHLASLLENVNDAIFAYDVNLRITAWNRRAEEQYGISAAEAIGAYAPDIVGSQLTAEQRDAVLRELVEIGRWQGEIIHTLRDGSFITVEATAMRLCDETGRVTGFVTVNRDITERKKAADEIRASREQLRKLSRRLVAAHEAERSFVADQLYNQAGQVLAALQMQLSRLGKQGFRSSTGPLIPMMETTIKEAMRELHEIAVQLRPVGLDKSTLGDVLHGYTADFCGTHGLLLQYNAGDGAGIRLPSDIATAVYRSIQEGLTNIARHAHASQVNLSLSRGVDRLTVTLADDGIGFGPATGPLVEGLGLASIRERLETVGGSFEIESGEPGTTLMMQVPLKHEEQPTRTTHG